MHKTILSHAPKYLTGSVIATGTTLLMTKYYTTVFSPAQFGILALYLVMFDYIRTFVSLNMDSGATRFYFDYRDTRRDEYLSTIFWFITSVAFVVMIVGMIFKDFISNWIAPDTQDVYLVTIFLGIGAVYVSFLTRILYNEHKSTSVLKHTIFQTFVNHFSSFAFISFLNLGILGRISGQGLGYFLNIFTLLREFSKDNLFRLKFVFIKSMASETFMLALPGIIAAFQNVVFVYMDRIFLKHYIGDSAVGVYTLGFMLGQGLSMVYEAISQAILPKVYSDMNENYEKARDELEHFSYRYYIGLGIITIVISLLSPLIVSIFSNENYSQASSVMPFVMAGFMMGGFYKIPSMILGYHKRVWFYPFLSAFAFGTNALLNWYLIPKYGIVGAGFASFIGLFLYSLVMQILSFRYMNKMYIVFISIGYIGILLFALVVFNLGEL
jgi:O-antigen/teichoic acid export membrane protein